LSQQLSSETFFQKGVDTCETAAIVVRMEKNVYMVVLRDETGRTSEIRVPQCELAEYIDDTFLLTSIQILAIIRLPN
jgi:hypothetical protein